VVGPGIDAASADARTVAWERDRVDQVCSDERGVILVLFALLLPLILITSVIVVDVGNWYVHKRRLQTLVDAGAFAGATKFVGCSFQFGNPPAANAAIKAAALEYAGDTARDASTRNVQEQEPDDVRVVLNSSRYWADGDAPTGSGPHPLDDTLDHDGNPATPGDPCSSKTLDVKATDDDAPLLFGFIPFVADPKSKARVEIRQIKEQAGMLPWAVPDVEPAAVAALFVDENTGQVFDHQLLMQQDDTSLPFAEWRTPVSEETVDLSSENTGVVILVSKVDDTPTLSTGGAGTLTTICSQSPGLVGCYAGDGNQDGLAFIHGWAGGPAGTPAAPQLRDVGFFSSGCEDDFAAPYFLRSPEGCALGVQHAVIDFGIDADPTRAPPDGVAATVELRGPGCGHNGCPMRFVEEGAAANESIWETTGVATLDSQGLGRLDYSIAWETESPAGATHSGVWTGVAHPYVADESSSPVDYLKITTSDVEPPVPYPYSRDTGALVSVVVTVGLRKPLAIEDPLVPPVLLRVASPSGSQNQAFDCDKNVNFATEIENGCQTTYGLNYDDWSSPKDGIKEWADILCEGYDAGDLPPDTTAPEPPASAPICVAVETGDKIGPFRQGLTKRFETPTCWPNNWPDTADEVHDFFLNHDFANDPRYVTLVITDFGTFQASGSDQVPVKYFAGFYATGWDVDGNVKPCLDNDPHPWYGTSYRKSLDNGDVWGHFVNIVVFSSVGRPNDQLCNFDELGNCIATLVE
jgi:Putative Flp pilus-assembly TadE/G-like